MRIAWMLTAMVVVVLVANNSLAEEWDFEDARVGSVPAGWSTAKTGKGPGSVWKVVLDPSAPQGPKVLAQVSSEGPNRLFNLCVAGETSLVDVDLTVAVKGVRGKLDQGGGPVWRYRDNDNYYVARINPLERNFRVYKVIRGKRSQLASADVDVDKNDPRAGDDNALSGRWHLRNGQICSRASSVGRKPTSAERTEGRLRVGPLESGWASRPAKTYTARSRRVVVRHQKPPERTTWERLTATSPYGLTIAKQWRRPFAHRGESHTFRR